MSYSVILKLALKEHKVLSLKGKQKYSHIERKVKSGKVIY